MSDERLEQDEAKDEDVEAHQRRTTRQDEATDEPSTDDSDDVEAHRRATT
jgi:hypothetical protein